MREGKAFLLVASPKFPTVSSFYARWTNSCRSWYHYSDLSPPTSLHNMDQCLFLIAIYPAFDCLVWCLVQSLVHHYQSAKYDPRILFSSTANMLYTTDIPLIAAPDTASQYDRCLDPLLHCFGNDGVMKKTMSTGHHHVSNKLCNCRDLCNNKADLSSRIRSQFPMSTWLSKYRPCKWVSP